MNCTNCGKEITSSICSNCGSNHTDLLYKMLEDAQVRRDYKEALSYMLMIRKACDDKGEREEIDRKIAKLQFSMTDLTGNSLNSGGNKGKKFSLIIKSALGVLVILAVFMVGMKAVNVLKNSKMLIRKKLPIALNLVLKEKDNSNEINIEKIEYIINLLQSREDLKLNMVLNGLLIEKIKIMNPGLIIKIKNLIDSGKLELLGTTYSESVVAANNDESNKWQIEAHKKILKEEFNFTPSGFWNEGGIWTEKLGKTLTDFGFEYVIIEDRVLKNSSSKASEYVIRSTENGKLLVINNDKDFIFKTERFLIGRDSEVLDEIENYILSVYDENNDGDYVLNYSSTITLEDIDLLSVEELLERLESLKGINIINYPMILNEIDIVREDISPIKSGVSIFADMEVDLLYDEKYSSWNDYNNNSNVMNEYRKFFRYHMQSINSLARNNSTLREFYKNLYIKGQNKYGKPHKKEISTSFELEIMGKIVEMVNMEADEFEEVIRRNHYIKDGKIVYLEKNGKIVFLYDSQKDELFENFDGKKRFEDSTMAASLN